MSVKKLLTKWIKGLLDVKRIKNNKCDEGVVPAPLPKTIPEDLINEYTMNGRMNLLYWFFDDRVLNNERLHITKKTYKRVFRQLQTGTFRYYEEEGTALLQALDNYPVKGKDVIIWGLAGCNCEAIAVWKGAKKVYVVEYNKPVCNHKRIEVLNHEEITQKAIMADFAISFSSFEHDGLGRYGDQLLPNGDLHAMQEAHKFLKNDGLLFLGVPLGKDCIVWNAHRIYGKNRLPLLLKGWQLIDVFDINTQISPEYPFDLNLGYFIQNVMVLKKIATDFPNDENLLGKNEKTGNRKVLFERINRVINNMKYNLNEPISDHFITVMPENEQFYY